MSFLRTIVPLLRGAEGSGANMANLKIVLIFIVGFVCTSKACPGCPQEEEVNNHQVLQFLKLTLSHFKAPAEGTGNELTTLVRVTKVTSQVVSGILYTYDFEAKGLKTHKLYSCHMVVLSQPWAAGDVIQVYQCKPLYLKELEHVISCVGCAMEQDVKDHQIQNFLQTTLTHYRAPAKGTDNELTTLIRVTRATTKVVEGILYTYDFEAKGVKSHKLYACHVVVLSQPWTVGDVVQEYECKPLYLNMLEHLIQDNSCPGCPMEQDVKEQHIQKFLQNILTHFKALAKGTDNELTTLVRVTRVTTKVVAGLLYTYDFQAKGVKTHKLYTCQMVVLSQPWGAGEVVKKYECEPLYLNVL